MVLVFGAFILGGERVIMLFGLGLAGAVALDSIIVRMALVPGLMLLAGKANWWLPRRLDRMLPHLNVEGDTHDGPTAASRAPHRNSSGARRGRRLTLTERSGMSDYAKVNLKEVEDSAAGRHLDVEARLGRTQLDSEHLGVSYLRYGANFRSPMGHRHRQQEEAYIVVSGSGRMKLNDEIVELNQWDAIRVAAGTVRAIEGGPDGIELVAVGANRPEGGDGEVVEGWWVD
jgi:mannose-6-phosphate isomerase-like protein (cupin superfamily)